MFRKPVHHIGMITGNPKPMSFTVANDVFLCKVIFLAKKYAKLYCFLINLIKILAVS
jgi:hypothetical protein